MAEAKRAPLEKFRTPKGVFVYPKLNTPDTKWKSEGEYGLKLRLSAEDNAPIIEKIEALAAAQYEETKAELIAEGKAKVKDGAVLLLKDGKPQKDKNGVLKTLEFADKAYRAVLDDDGEETGEVEFNIKMKAERKDKKTGKTIKMTPAIFDAKGKELKVPPQIWGGTVGKVSGQYMPFYTAIGVGVSLRLSGVQILDLVSGGQRDAKSLGFEEEEGYEGEDAPAAEAGDSPAPDADEEF